MIFQIKAENITKLPKSGFSLIESLLSLSLFLFILISSFEFFVSTRNHFFELKDEQEINQAAYTTLDKIRMDLCAGGCGLIAPQTFGLIDAIQINNNTLIIESKVKDIPLANDLVVGQTYIPVVSTAGIKKGQKLCITDPDKGEITTIRSVDKHGLTLSSSLSFSYVKGDAAVVLIRTVSFYLDTDRGILRRKVNASPAQPLLEDVYSFDFTYEATSNIISLRLTLKPQEEKEYETSFFPKNMALVSAQ
jgi:type II secretory pathway pseudopilin PulG